MGNSSKPKLVGVTVSLSFGDKTYGNGTESFMNASAKWDDTANPDFEDAINQGLDLYFLVWKTLLSSRYATGILKAEEFKATLEATEVRLAKVRAFLQKQVEANVE